ncbi:MAG TPA: D-alanyl-D-alanine carboxypeptidase/D-alanyl-D-alanine-endopeptidase [Burkholderiales bacterium]|nr:D-alanyl-D-alanine carboxypeptidase/D-alanyl-D-alanine-endopeptidase [Burkholderiales bacterium]
MFASACRYPALFLLSAFALLAQAQLTPPPAVAQALAAAKIPSGAAAIVVQEVGAPRPTLNINPATPMNPASVMKLVTTYAALELLGPAYRWKTEAWVTGPLREGVLEGDLVLKGYGDPKLDLEAFWMLLRSLRGKGLREIRGDLVLDRSHFERTPGDPAQFDGDAFRPYNVLPDALLVNYKSLRFAFAPEPERGTVRLYVEPRPPSLDVVNTLRLAEGGCPEGIAFRELLKATFEPARQRAIFSGRYPLSCGEKEMNVALLAPNDQVAGTLRQLWTEMGGAWTGAVREGQASPGAQLLHTQESPSLGEIVRHMNKFSNNIMARHLYLTLGAESAGPPANGQKAFTAVRAWLAAKGIAAPELVMENGSGLSRIERISAGSLAGLLQAAWRSPVMPEFIASMPIVGQDGTMRRRLKENGVAGRAHVKSGLLQDARAMAGYVLDRGGRVQVVVMIVNHPSAPETQPAMDALLRWVYER